jgi:hypothetical protein
MGTNYYTASDDGEEGIHIGKRSAGWSWCWADPPEPPSISALWSRYAATHPDLRVIDEYGRDCGPLSLFVFASERQKSDFHVAGKDWS